MKHIFKGTFDLSENTVEKEFAKIKANNLFDKEDLFIDLSQIRFSQLSAINYFVLKIDILFKKQQVNDIFLALPLPKLTKKETASKSYTDEIKQNLLNSRIRVNGFLKNAGFISSLLECVSLYNNSIYFTENYEFETEFKIDNFEKGFEEIIDFGVVKHFGYKYLFPLEWIQLSETIDFEKIESRFNQVLENSERGLDPFDVNVIKNVIFYELAKNVKEHTQGEDSEKRFLLSIGLISTNSLWKEENKNEIERSFLDWTSTEKINSLVEIYFGDTGGGFFNNDDFIVRSREDGANTDSSKLEWSFGKWSARKNDEERRGTKGLYRIKRIVNSYNGIYHITTNKINGGFQKGGERNEKFISRVCNNFEGSFIQIKLCPFSEVKEFKFNLTNNKTLQDWKTININFENTIERIKSELLSDFKKSKDDILAILDTKTLHEKDDELIDKLDIVLKEISLNAHPNGVVVYIDSALDKNTLDVIISSVNEYIKNKTFDQIPINKEEEEIYDPVIVIFGNRTFWYGGNQKIIELLNEVYANNFEVKIEDLEAFKILSPEEKIHFRLELENNNRIVHINNKGEFELNFVNIDLHFEKLIKSRIDHFKLDNKLYCSPKVQIVNNWIDVNKLIENNVLGFALILYLKVYETVKEINKNNLFILIDHEQHLEIATSLLTLLGLKLDKLKNIQQETQLNSLKRFKLFPEDSSVIILTSIISSSETIRRLVKFVKRDNANPIVILSLSNHRKKNINELKTWEDITSIKSIYTENKVESILNENEYDLIEKKEIELKKGDFEFIQPTYELKRSNLLKYYDDELSDLFISSKSLNYNHIGIKNDRHFTFYLDKYKVLNTSSLIWDKLEHIIKKWKEENQINDFVFYIKEDFQLSEGSKFKEFLKTFTNNIVIYKDDSKVQNDSNVFIIDFGFIKGDSINKILAETFNVKNLFICILFNQSNSKINDYYKRITQIENFGQFDESPTKLNIDFLYLLPLNYFDRESCPICNHIDALDFYKQKDPKYMFLFSEDRQLRLNIRQKSEVTKVNFPFDFYFEQNISEEQELSSVIISKMFTLKNLLELSLNSTEKRIELYFYLINILKNKEELFKDSESEIYSTIYYLSYEVHWLQKEPLNLRDFRFIISEFSHFIGVMKFEKLFSFLKESNTSKISPQNLTTRYKYSAISLLRASNKLKFCESVFSIIESIEFNAIFGDNLFQNTIYHSYSIYKNKYNKSRRYFNELKKSFEQAKSLQFNNDEQKDSVTKLLNLINLKLTEYDIENLDDLKIIKKLKESFLINYKTTEGHPYYSDELREFDFSNFDNYQIDDLISNKEDSKYYERIKLRTNNLYLRWTYIQLYIYKEIIPYIQRLSYNFKNTFLFKNAFGLAGFFNSLYGDESYPLLQEFNQLVLGIDKTPFEYLLNKSRYDKLQMELFNKLIKTESDFNNYLAEFPSSITNMINSYNIQAKFPKGKYSIVETNIFYPRYELNKLVNAILSSIKNRLLEDYKNESSENGIYTEVDLFINQTVEDKYVLLKIKYNKTDSISHKHINKSKGGFESIQNEIQLYGGMLHYYNDNEFFNLDFKFLKYE